MKSRAILGLFFYLLFGATATGRATILTVTGEQLNVYAGPGRTYEVLDVVKKDEKFELLAEQEGWYKISVDGQIGWIAAKGAWIKSEKTIAELLAQADGYFRRQQFTTPPDANAFDLYQEVLRQDPNNIHARQKIDQMAKIYKTWAEMAEQRGDQEKARIFRQRYLFLIPDDPKIKDGRALMNASAPSPETSLQVLRLRADPMSISAENLQHMLRKYHFNHPADWSKFGFSASVNGDFHHDYELVMAEGLTMVVDYATELMWPRAGSPTAITWQAAQDYIQQLNTTRLGGYADWRLPTLEELASLLTATKQQHRLYLPLEFDATLLWCWSADPVVASPGMAWYVSFSSGGIQPHEMINSAFVLAVRSLHQPK